MKFYKLFIAIFLIGISCKTVKKVATIQEAINKKDTTQIIVINETPTVDSAKIVRDIMTKVVTNNISFNSFNAKIKIEYESAENSDNYMAYLSMIKDSIIFIRIRGSFLGIAAEGLQVQIKKDSVILVKKVGEKYIQYRSIDYLKEATEIPFDFFTLQNLLIGNPVFMNQNIVSYKDGPSTLLVLMIGDIFKHLLTLSTNDFRITHSKLDDIDLQRNRTCDISFSDYQPMGTYQFSTKRQIVVSEKSRLTINLDFKEFSLNEPLKYMFELPKNYKRK
jgi:hypothetical protein